jgi:hypothetical protein
LKISRQAEHDIVESQWFGYSDVGTPEDLAILGHFWRLAVQFASELRPSLAMRMSESQMTILCTQMTSAFIKLPICSEFEISR